jgi:hypothetical protein
MNLFYKVQAWPRLVGDDGYSFVIFLIALKDSYSFLNRTAIPPPAPKVMGSVEVLSTATVEMVTFSGSFCQVVPGASA